MRTTTEHNEPTASRIRRRSRVVSAQSALRLTGSLSVLIVALTFIALPAANAAASDQRCGYGDAQALLNQAPVAFRLDDGSAHQPGLGGLVGRCQFRLYQDGETVTFSDEDYILGGILIFWTYDELEEMGWTRAEAIADMKLATDRVEISSVVGGEAGAFEDVPLIVTHYRDALSPVGHVVYNHRAFITRLPAGEYLVQWTHSYQGVPLFTSTVRVVITAS